PVLVLAGPPGWDHRIESALHAVPRSIRVLRAGYLPFSSLPALLGGASCVAYPSLGEGFGLPVLEAMACGAAVLTTRRLALPEIGGDAVAYCGVRAEEIGASLAGLLADPARRSALRSAAVRRAKEFSWAASADLHREAYARAASNRRRAR
ncbi:MAG: glycosyltransferase, partial [Sciscionella sp.]